MSHVVDLLKEHNILSVPVIKDGKPIGLLDTLDIATYVVHLWRFQRDAASGDINEQKLPGRFSSLQAQHLINFCGRNDYRFLHEDGTLGALLKEFAENTVQYHRMAIHNKEGKIVGIISQTDLLQFIGKHLDMLPQGNKTLKELGLLRGVVTMRADIILGDTLEVIASRGISAVALTDNENKLIANFSASDLRGAARGMIGSLAKSTIDFLHKYGRGPRPPIVESDSLTFSKAVDKLARLSYERIHRLYLLDDNDHPIGVFSMTDVFPVLCPTPTESL
jgi:CBS domain-containing protein